MIDRSALRITYDCPEALEEAMELIKHINFIMLNDCTCTCSPDIKAKLYEKAKIINTSSGCITLPDEYASKAISFWQTMVRSDEERTLGGSPTFFANDIPDNIGDHQFHFVRLIGFNSEKISTINTEIMYVTGVFMKTIPEWYRALANVKYFMMNCTGEMPDPPQDLACKNLQAYEIVCNGKVKH